MAYDLLPFSWAAISLLRGNEKNFSARLIAPLCLFFPVIYFYAAKDGVAGATVIPWLMTGWCLAQKPAATVSALSGTDKNSRALRPHIG